ncbi:hypothetical protein [Nocardiopsis ansamitocini]|uniref:Uncharacterized protein n=1 Tax=Nocardiopsis ansamitocini TaxID=1670832 RepID=A0A9W6P4P8_9ACTN|nr:hypothetical protein [Nocardiopsis ansamitocini]GLU47111.1 hypothetical protein Nans01_14620 [Nocardiopsis ansamitocini]
MKTKILELFEKVRGWLVDWWWLDPPVAAILSFICWYLIPLRSQWDVLGNLDLPVRQAIYTDIIQLSTIFAGFGAVAFTVFISSSSPTSMKLKNGDLGPRIIRLWIAALSFPWISAFVIILAKATDSGGVGSTSISRWLVLGAVLVILFQMVRTLRVFYQISTLEITEQKPARKTASKGIVIDKNGAHL